MAVITNISQVGSDVIRAVAEPVAIPLDSDARQLITDLTDTMRYAQLVGMAAPQVGRSARIFVTEVRRTSFRNEGIDKLRVFVNPEILAASEQQETIFEGCGSVAHGDLFGEVSRPASITLRYYDENSVQHTEEFSGFLARVIQHELDHLNGTVFVDKLTTTKTIKSANEYRKQV